jgi:hypothetical protein
MQPRANSEMVRIPRDMAAARFKNSRFNIRSVALSGNWIGVVSRIVVNDATGRSGRC